MIFRQLFDATSSTYTYLIGCEKTREALLIDPVQEHVDQYLKLLSELNLKLVLVADTHVHADHVTASGKLMQKTNCKVLMGDHAKADCVAIKIKDNEEFCVGDIKLKALYTPGHTDDSYCYILPDRIFTGDSLLIRATGRTDFQNGSAEAAYDSLFNKILCLPDETFVYPAHDYNGMTVSTIGEEKHFNPRLQVKSKQEYINLMNSLNLAKPKLIDIAVPANLKCGL